MRKFVFCKTGLYFPAVSPWPERLLFYDGECGLCSRTVQVVAGSDRRGNIRFASLQGEWALRAEKEGLIDRTVDSVWWVEQGKKGVARLEAVRGIAREIGGVWHVLRLSALLPRSLQKWLYDFVAKRRYQWFGEGDVCELQQVAELKKRLLDGEGAA